MTGRKAKPSSDAQPTLEDVARRAGVSTATVSRVVNTPGKVAKATVERVQAAIAKTGYVPNLLAGGLASSRSRFVAALVPSIASSVFNDTMEAMSRALTEEGYLVMLALLDEGPGHAGVLDAVLGRRPDGVILTSIEDDDAIRLKLKRSGSPIIETWGLPANPIDLAVGFSHRDVGRDVARHVKDLGYKRPLLLSAGMRRARERTEAFARAWVKLGGAEPAKTFVESPTRYRPAREALRGFLDAGGKPDIVICSSDWLADACVVEARARGMKVPSDLAVFGFGDTHASSEGAVPLSTVRIDGAQIGHAAARMLLDRAAGRKITDPIVDVGFEILDRESA
ncbi:MAG TPA: LacI family DNA-binding transcriptional regulator [Hyphomonadaceae bacterium]|jgi:LacI family gluconate utilization system Gnt-I transcriptional repressor|nr:LacI family DNA-binding transcriptional regulator [Hyphomonadaceae bacterium]